MELLKEEYSSYTSRLPGAGKQIIGQYDQKWMIVYQAFNPLIGQYAVKHQRFGGENYNFNRMSWIKPGFLWMMYWAGWAVKQDQECILALWVERENFDFLLSQPYLLLMPVKGMPVKSYGNKQSASQRYACSGTPIMTLTEYQPDAEQYNLV